MTVDFNLTGLSAETIKKLLAVFKRSDKLSKVLLYGSRALGNYKTGSDIDLTLIGEQLELRDVLKIEADLDDLMTPYSFDLSIYHQINSQNLTDHIQRVGVILYERKE